MTASTRSAPSGTEEPARDYRSSHLGEGGDYHRKFSEHVYRAIVWEIEQEILLALLGRFLGDPSAARLLDFACGTGRVLALLEDRVGDATGVDVSPSMLAVAREELRRARLLCLDVTRAPELDSERFQIITAFRFFPNAEPELRDAVMAKLSRLLAGGGILVFNNHLRCGSLRHRVRRWRFALRLKHNRRDLHCMSDREAIALAERHGLELLTQYCFGVLPILKERRPLLPAWLVRAIERRGVRVDRRARLRSHAIYVFRRGEAAGEGLDPAECSSS